MTDDFEFDPLEQELRRRFDTLDTAPDDPDAVLDAMRPRLRRAQRNHRIVTSAVATLVVVGAVVVGLAAFRGSDTGRSASLRPAGSTPSAPTTTTTAPPDQATPTVSTPAGPDNSGPTASTPTGGTLPEPTGTGAPAGGTTLRRRRPSPDRPPCRRAVTRRTHRRAVRSWSTDRVRRSHWARARPRPDTPKKSTTTVPTRVEVRFDNGQTEWRIRVDLVNGELEAETTQH